MNCADKAISTDLQFYPQVVAVSLSSLEKKNSGAGSLHHRRFFWIKNIPGFVTFKILGFTGEHPSVNPRTFSQIWSIHLRYRIQNLRTQDQTLLTTKQIRYNRVCTLLSSLNSMTFHEFFHDLFKFSMKGYAVNFKNFQNYSCFKVFFNFKQFNRKTLVSIKMCAVRDVWLLLSISHRLCFVICSN